MESHYRRKAGALPGILILILVLPEGMLAGGMPRLDYVPPEQPALSSDQTTSSPDPATPPDNPDDRSRRPRGEDASPVPGSDTPQAPGGPRHEQDTADAPPIKPFSQTFRFTTSGWPFAIRAERTLAPVGDGTWMMQLKASNWLGEIRETTRFRWRGCLPQTLSWEYQRTGLGQDRRASIVVDPETQTVQVNEKDKPSRSYSLSGPATDKVSQVLALQCLLEHDKRPLQFPVADEDGVEQVRYVIQGKERLDTPAGRIRALQLEQVRDPASERKTLLWFAPEDHHALVRLLQREGRDEHQLIIQD